MRATPRPRNVIETQRVLILPQVVVIRFWQLADMSVSEVLVPGLVESAPVKSLWVLLLLGRPSAHNLPRIAPMHGQAANMDVVPTAAVTTARRLLTLAAEARARLAVLASRVIADKYLGCLVERERRPQHFWHAIFTRDDGV